MATTRLDRILRMLKKTRVLRLRDVQAIGISRTYLNELHSEGVLGGHGRDGLPVYGLRRSLAVDRMSGGRPN